MTLMSELHDEIIAAWNKRNKDKSDKENTLRIANAFNVEISYVQRILGDM